MKKYKILHVLYMGKLAGAETLVKHLLKKLDESKFENHVCFLHSGGTVADQIKSFGIQVHIIGMKHGFDIISSIKYYCLLKRYNFDLIHNHTPNVLAIMIGYLHTRMWIYHIHHCSNLRLTGLRKVILAYFFKRAVSSIAISTPVKEDFIKNFGVKREKVELIYNAVELETFFSSKKNKDLILKYVSDNEVLILGCVGRLSPEKGYDLLFDALQHVKANINNFHLFILGEGDQLNNLQQYSKKLDLQENITFLGTKENIEEYFKLFDVFILPSRNEPFGLVVVEAMASGNPIIAFATGGVTEIMRDQIEGFLIKPFDTKAMSERIIELIKNKNLRESFGNAGRKRAQLFSIDRFVKQIDELYQNILNNQ